MPETLGPTTDKQFADPASAVLIDAGTFLIAPGPIASILGYQRIIREPAEFGYGPRARFRSASGLGHSRILADPVVITSAVAFLQDSDVPKGLDLSA